MYHGRVFLKANAVSSLPHELAVFHGTVVQCQQVEKIQAGVGVWLPSLQGRGEVHESPCAFVLMLILFHNGTSHQKRDETPSLHTYSH